MYEYVPLYGMTLEKTIDELSKYNENDDYVYTIFNGHYIYSDSLDLESIVKSFYNMDLDKFNYRCSETGESLEYKIVFDNC